MVFFISPPHNQTSARKERENVEEEEDRCYVKERERVRCEIRFLLIASLSLGLQKYTLYTCFYVNFIFSSFSLTAVICYESLFSLFFL